MNQPRRVLLQQRRRPPRRLKVTKMMLIFWMVLSLITVSLVVFIVYTQAKWQTQEKLPASITQRNHHRIKTTEASNVVKMEHFTSSTNNKNDNGSSSSSSNNKKQRLEELIQARQAARRYQARSELRSATTVEEWTRPFFDYNVPVQPTAAQTLPPPSKRYFNATLIVLVLSDRNHFEQRQAIRETWGNGQALYFVVGGPNQHHSKENNYYPNNNRDSNSSSNQTPWLLQQEQELHQDLIDSIHPESYRSLPHKLKFGFQWIAKNYYYHHHHHHHHRRNNIDSNNNDNDDALPEWILKIDDDSLVRNVSLVEQVLLEWTSTPPSPPRGYHNMIVLGHIQLNTTVQRKGPWAESPAYTNTTYPPWPKGSCGYIVNRHVVEYIANNFDILSCYQGEDSSLGIWLRMQQQQQQQQLSTMPLWFYNSSYFVQHRKCHQTDWLILGHQFAPAAIRACFQVAAAASAAAVTMTAQKSAPQDDEQQQWNLTANAKLIALAHEKN